MGLTGKHSRIKMNLESVYQKKLALNEEVRAKNYARADKQLVETKSELSEEARKNKENGASAAKAMIGKFNGMIQTLEMRSTSSIKKLTGVSKTTISQAKAKLDAAMTKYKKQRELVKISKSQ